MIVNLTQHAASPEQVAAGVVEVNDRAALARLLTFDALPDGQEVQDRAEAVADMAAAVLDEAGIRPGSNERAAMIGGAPFLMAPLEGALRRRAIKPVYAFSRRESVEETLPDGSTRKTAVFRHAGFVPGIGEGFSYD